MKSNKIEIPDSGETLVVYPPQVNLSEFFKRIDKKAGDKSPPPPEKKPKEVFRTSLE